MNKNTVTNSFADMSKSAFESNYAKLEEARQTNKSTETNLFTFGPLDKWEIREASVKISDLSHSEYLRLKREYELLSSIIHNMPSFQEFIQG
jgi:hypothetical protein